MCSYLALVERLLDQWGILKLFLYCVKQKYLYLSFVGRKIAWFYHNRDRRRIWFGLIRLISPLFGENFGCPCECKAVRWRKKVSVSFKKLPPLVLEGVSVWYVVWQTSKHSEAQPSSIAWWRIGRYWMIFRGTWSVYGPYGLCIDCIGPTCLYMINQKRGYFVGCQLHFAVIC